jgi:hypothetical protein
MKIFTFLFYFLVINISHASTGISATTGIIAEDIHVADSQKTKLYLKEGLVIGGDRTIDDVIILDVRHSMNKDYERIVIDLDGNKNGEPAVIQRPPYYQVEISPIQKRLVVTVFGKPKLAFDPARVKKGFSKSGLIKGIELFPLLEKDRWSFAITFNQAHSSEVFELANPVRVILDLKK